MGDLKLAYDEQITNFILWLSLTSKVLSAYMENTLNSIKAWKIDIQHLHSFWLLNDQKNIQRYSGGGGGGGGDDEFVPHTCWRLKISAYGNIFMPFNFSTVPLNTHII